QEKFDILYTRDFNPNSDELILFRNNVEKDHIGTYLVSLCKFFYEEKSNTHALQHFTNNQNVQTVTPAAVRKIFHQCIHCFTVYDEQAGEPENNIEAGTSFNDLPETYHYPLYDAEKVEFIAVEENMFPVHAIY